jgi:hypothetical protein
MAELVVDEDFVNDCVLLADEETAWDSEGVDVKVSSTAEETELDNVWEEELMLADFDAVAIDPVIKAEDCEVLAPALEVVDAAIELPL